MKNKVAAPFKIANFDIMYGKGIDRMGKIIDIGVKNGVINKSGAWFSYGEEILWQGRENIKEYLRENIEILNKIEAELYEKIGSKRKVKNEENDSENNS